MSASNRGWWIFLGAVVLCALGGAWRLAGRVADGPGTGGTRLQISLRHGSAQRPENLQPAQEKTLASFRSPWTVKLTSPDGQVLTAPAHGLAGTVVFEGLAPGHYKIAVWFFESGPIPVLGQASCDVREGENAAALTLAPEDEARLNSAMAQADPTYFYGYAQPQFVVPPRLSEAVSDLRELTVEALPDKLHVAQWAFPVRFPVVPGRPMGLPATAYVFTLQLRGREVHHWRQWVAPGRPSIPLSDEPGVLAAVAQGEDPSRVVEDVKAAVRAGDTAKVTAALYRLDFQRRWNALEEIAAWLRADGMGAAVLPFSLRRFHATLAKQRTFADAAAHHREWVERLPESPTARVQIVQDYIVAAFKARGSGFADTVTPQGWQGFRAALARAEKAVADALAAGVSDPELWVQRIELATIGDHPTEEGAKLFDQAVAQAPCYAPIYQTRSWYVLPRWGGRPGEVGRVADRALQAAGNRGDAIYTDIATDVCAAGEAPLSPDMGLTWPPIKREIERNARPMDVDILAALAVAAKDKPTARALFARIETPDLRMWNSREAYERARAWATR